jgi:hypothetical protein
MKLVLSRKGFDSSVGGYPSPILPDGRMASIPIPSSHDTLSYDDIAIDGGLTFGQLLKELGATRKIGSKGAHLDPDLIPSSRPRKAGWRPSLGQIGAAAGHLRNQGIGPGDLLLFYGWFRQTEHHRDGLRWSGDPAGFHAIYGYLQVGEVVDATAAASLPVWLADHPHTLPSRTCQSSNTIYVASSSLADTETPGAGVFEFHDDLRLSRPGESRSRWRIDPAIFQHLEITYHSAASWRDGYFQSYPRAQEYVIHADDQATQWALDLCARVRRWA